MIEEKQILLEREELGKALTRMAHEVVEKNADPAEIVLIGIRSRGVFLARRMARKIEELTQFMPSLGIIDVTPYRDDHSRTAESNALAGVAAEVAVDEKTVVLIDDVIFSGRTIRAALEAVTRLGQPKRILVAVLVDRGARQLPIRADIVGKNIQAGENQRVNVLLEEMDGVDQINITDWQGRRSV
jgi:pyrimidine operon attenuation protein/uracil phosphoribosyltransferase